MIYPDRFIPVFERMDSVLSWTCTWWSWSARCSASGWIWEKRSFPFPVNQSKLLFYQEDYIERLCEITDRYGISRKYIVLEILEGLAAETWMI